jgi:hypothetical protein
MTFSPDPEIRLRQKYESNRPFEDSLFVEVDKVSASSEGRQAGGVSLEWESAPADICANKHKGAETSIAAHQRIAATSSDMRAEIYRFALKRAGFGITVKEVEGEFNMLRNSASARLSELKVRGLLEKRGDTRESCAVLVPRFAEAK